MPASQSFTLAKAERICSKKLTDRLFNGSSGRSLSAFPLRMVYTVVSREEDAPAALMLVSVPKRHFKRAVKRNRVKRQVREAFRKNKQLLLPGLESSPDRQAAMAFIWQSDELFDTATVERKVQSLLQRLSEQLSERLSAATVEESIAPAKQTIEVPGEPKEDKA